jgi:hypothetical protein
MRTPNELFYSYVVEIEHHLDAETVKAGSNGTGYFNGLTSIAPPSPQINRSRFMDEHDRQGVVFYTPVGNVVIFQRYTDHATGIYAYNTAPAFRSMLPNGALPLELLEWYMCGPTTIPNRFQEIVKDMQKGLAALEKAEA